MIEGVMMRSPRFIAVAVRKPNRRIVVRSHRHHSVLERYPFFKKPVLRGIVGLVESMFQGIEALSFSAEVAAEGTVDGKGKPAEKSPEKPLSNWAILGSIFVAFAMGMGLFVALPHLITVLISSNAWTADDPRFHIVDGAFKTAILLLYVYLISMMKDIYRVFQYHGGEHKSIYAFEKGLPLTVENAHKQSVQHPRCGTSFLLFLVLISILVFSIVFPLFGVTQFSDIPVLNHAFMVIVKIILMLPVAGIAYEFIRFCAFRMNSPILRAAILPGLILQNLTTRIPEAEHLEVALASLRQVLRLEKGLETLPSDTEPSEKEIGSLDELVVPQASVEEFAEA